MIILGERKIKIDDYYKILFQNEEIEISAEALNRVENCYNFLDEFHKNKIIYGINTGLGPMAQYQISVEDRISLQYNAF